MRIASRITGTLYRGIVAFTMTSAPRHARLRSAGRPRSAPRQSASPSILPATPPRRPMPPPPRAGRPAEARGGPAPAPQARAALFLLFDDELRGIVNSPFAGNVREEAR